MSYNECLSRISQLDALIRSVSPNWSTTDSLAGTSSSTSSSTTSFSNVMASYATRSSSTTTHYSSATMKFVSPLPTGKLSQSYGPTDLVLEPPATVDGVTYAHFHGGIDLAASLGTTVRAAASGTVTMAGRASDGAVVVKIQHDNGYTSLYGHLDPSLQVAVGQHVEAGQGIGKVGLTGNTTGPHLHFGLSNAAGTAVDPTPWLTAGHLPAPATLMGPSTTEYGAMVQVSGAEALAKFDAASSKIPYAAEIRAAAIANGLDPSLLAGLVYNESNFYDKALSRCGACGLTQLMPGTASGLGVTDIWDVQQNLNGGAKYLARQIKRFGRVDMALAAYNAGPNAIARLGAVPDSKKRYVSRILTKWQSFQGASV
jgi:hypothetical protein